MIQIRLLKSLLFENQLTMNKKIIPFVALILCIVFSCTKKVTTFETKDFKLEINRKGFITSFCDKTNAKEYLPENEFAPLLALYKDSVYLKPEACQYNQTTNEISLKYPGGYEATIKIDNKVDYLRFELLSVEPRNGLEAVVWGPYPTTIQEKIGETVCVVRNEKFAIGMQALNSNTIEGLPDGDDNAGGGGVIDPLPGQILPDSLKDKIGQKVDVNVNVTGDMPAYVRLYRGSAAVKKSFGSELRLFSRDRRIPRVIQIQTGGKKYPQFVEPIDVDFIGSAIALFGCPEKSVFDNIEKIELGEKLPHPMLNGVWIKKSTVPGEAYLLNEGDPLQAEKYARACDFKLIHIGDVFKSWGHFGLKTKRFPEGSGDIRRTTEALRKDGISIGVHTLTMFTTTNDPYVTPVPSDSLCKMGTTILSKGTGKDDQVIYIKDPSYFRFTGNTHTVKIGKELISYLKVSDNEPFCLLDCKRGQFGTTVSEHSQGTLVEKLVNSDYHGFYPDLHLQDAYAKRLAEVCNETGIDLMDFDGFGGGSPTGQGCYGAARFIDLWYKNLDRYRLTCGAGTFHYYWHIYAFMNWGEPWYNALRESQVNYRIENQRYFDRNLMPGMLGWFTLNPEFRPEEVEWIQARSAGFNAGYLLRVDESVEKNGFKDQLFEEIREWQKARKEKVFSQKQLEELQNPRNEFHLEKVSDNQWNLFPVKLFRGFEYKFRMTQTGEPVTSKFTFENSFADQPLKFYITAMPVNGNKTAEVSNLILNINNYQSITIKKPLKAGDRVFCDGKSIWLCDLYWRKLDEINGPDLPSLLTGENKIEVTGDFSGGEAPLLKFEFKTVGKPESVKKIN